MRSKVAVLALLGAAGVARAGGPRVPVGRLPDTARPTAYRIELTVDPAAAGFGGHTEIDAVLARPARTLFLHGLGLRVSRAQVRAGSATVDVRYREVHESGVARLDFPTTLPAGAVTLSFDHTAEFATGAAGIFRAEAGGSWYAWTQLEATDARRVFPCFDEPGFKTPFTVTVTAPASAKVFANAPEQGATPSGATTVHTFAPTLPLPTYLVALGVGDFEVIEVTAPPNAVRKEPLPMRVIATRGQSARMSLAATEGPRLLGFIEEYLGIPFPYPKLDLLSSPAMAGAAMENAGLIIFDDTVLLLDPGAPVSQLRAFGEVVAHEMAHQWFGDLVTPAWWTDIWLNESFAEWMGKKVAERWRPDLDIAASELSEAFRAMDDDALGHGRPIRQAITESRQIASAFDDITYRKGALMLTMFETFLGPDRFAEGVRLHLERHRHGTATAEDFFRSLGEAAREPRLVPAMRTFTDQTGVPVVAVSETGGGSELGLSQARYRPLGVRPTPGQTWKIPMCLSRDAERSCTLLETASGRAPPPPGNAPLQPNAGGAGYYRFRLDASGWDRLIAGAASLPAREALALADSVWADFAAGTGSFERVVATARALGAHPDRLAVEELGGRLKSLGRSALTPGELPGYRALMRSLYGPRLAALGLDPRAGAYAAEPAAAQALRESLLPLVALEGRDEELRARLTAAAVASLGGDDRALDPAIRGTALAVAVQERGGPVMRQLAEVMGRSSDPLFRRQASLAIGQADTPELARTALGLAGSGGLQSSETVWIVFSLSREPGAREELLRLDGERYKRIVDAFPGYARSVLVNVFDGHCRAGDAARIEAHVRPKLKGLGGGELELSQVKERIGLCVALRKAKGREISAVLGR